MFNYFFFTKLTAAILHVMTSQAGYTHINQHEPTYH